MNLSDLATPFAPTDIEWRVSRAGYGSTGKGLYCCVLAYITARAIEERLDSVCGPENWRNEEPRIFELQGGKDGARSAFAVGLSIRVRSNVLLPTNEYATEWITKWDVAEPTNIEPAKGGFSGAMKRAGAQWGIGRYLYHLDEVFAETTETKPGSDRIWNWARLPKDKGGGEYWWKTPGLPAWALPVDVEVSKPVTKAELDNLKSIWRHKFLPASKNAAELREGFARFVTSIVGEFPIADLSCWTQDALERCTQRITDTSDPSGVCQSVPFE